MTEHLDVIPFKPYYFMEGKRVRIQYFDGKRWIDYEA